MLLLTLPSAPLPPPFIFLERVIAWMFQGFHISLKVNVNLLYDVP